MSLISQVAYYVIGGNPARRAPPPDVVSPGCYRTEDSPVQASCFNLSHRLNTPDNISSKVVVDRAVITLAVCLLPSLTPSVTGILFGGGSSSNPVSTPPPSFNLDLAFRSGVSSFISLELVSIQQHRVCTIAVHR